MTQADPVAGLDKLAIGRRDTSGASPFRHDELSEHSNDLRPG